MVYGPIDALLVEYFRAKVRYTSMSIPYHFGNGWFGGLLPLTFTALVGATIYGSGYVPFAGVFDLRGWNTTQDPNGNIYIGLTDTIFVAPKIVVLGTLFLREPGGVQLLAEVGGEHRGLMTAANPAQ